MFKRSSFLRNMNVAKEVNLKKVVLEDDFMLVILENMIV